MNKTFKMGRIRPRVRHPRLSLRNYLLRSMSTPPSTCDFSKKAMPSLRQVYLNDSLGDCVIAGLCHTEGVLTGNAGNIILYTPQQVVSLYSAIGGFDPNNPQATDNGCDIQTALAYWQNTGAPAGSHQISGWLAVNPHDPQECRIAAWLFENLVFGIELPDPWITPFPSADNFVWRGANSGPPDPQNGHCVVCPGKYDNQSLAISTWGMVGWMTNQAVSRFCDVSSGGELYTIISHDGISKATQKAPSGFDWSQLIADFEAVGGTVKLSK